MNRRQFLRVGAVGAAASVTGCTKAVLGTNQGRVVEKTVRADETRVLSATLSGVSARDEYPGNAGSDPGNVVVNESVGTRLTESFGTVTYEVTLEQYRSAWPNDAREGERTLYTTHRTLFNGIQAGDSITFQPDPTDTGRISSISCVAADRESLSARCSTGDGGGGD